MNSPVQTTPGSSRAMSIEAMGVTGIVFALLAFIAVEMLRGLPGWSADHATVEQWFGMAGHRNQLTAVVLIMVMASIALLWFIGTIRRRIGRAEDQLFATVFLGSGLILITVLLTAVAAFAVPATLAQQVSAKAAADAYPVGHGLGMILMTIVAPRIAAVFMLSLANLARITGAFPKWLTILSTVAALFMLVAVTVSIHIAWILPTWCLVVSVVIMWRRKRFAAT
ncbi:hypothetical protein ACFXG4_05635 [Nocardia sp. NPDC059246]|uniref:hypothetical protein n=1 Tax=unclassified Nocardia TaxID=2637762 RepID=UPI00369421BB